MVLAQTGTAVSGQRRPGKPAKRYSQAARLHDVIRLLEARHGVTVDELAQTVAKVAGKRITLKHVPGPVGVQSRNFSNERIYSLGWKAKVFLEEGIRLTYPWVDSQVKAAQLEGKTV